uniref:Uncharacterized protein n=1 Tax=Anguilla anguilla TaxID=7936 RepID=A0A0E9RKV5_ANGAN
MATTEKRQAVQIQWCLNSWISSIKDELKSNQ